VYLAADSAAQTANVGTSVLVSLESARKRHRQDGFTCREGPVTFLSLNSQALGFSADSTSPPLFLALTLTR
jgi:hypothetical protein